MTLAHIELDNLSISPLNMRHAKKAPDTSDILPSVRKRGILMPLLVRPNGTPTSFEIVAGRRRWFAARTVKEEQGSFPPVPCHIMDEGDDADALEASLIENIARQDPDEMTQYEVFTRLVVKEGRTVEQKKKLVEEITRVSVEILGGSPESVDILITDVKRENWATGGKLWLERTS